MKRVKIGLRIAIAIWVIYGCEESTINYESALEEEVEADTSALSDAELWEVLGDELTQLENRNGRVVDVSGMDVVKENPKKIYVHYMPWYQNLFYDGYWGHHWTMANQNPDIIDENGHRQIASHYYPMIGPYSSKDPDLHEYHFLMMKLAGIDGVIFDWYGSRDLYDYQLIKEGTETFIETLEDLGLSFSIMYEDRVAVQAAEVGISPSHIAAAQEDFAYINEEYFSSDWYLTHNDKNMLFVFGPHYITTENEWNQVFEVIPETSQPSFLTLWAAQHMVGQHASGEFLWIAPDHLAAHEHYYSVYPQYNAVTVGSVYPGFNSFYNDGGWGPSHSWTIDMDNGNTFVETLNYTHHEVADFIQIATWNDFGEGTMIEPTEQYGFMYLQLLQQYTGVDFDPEDLQITLDLYRLRKAHQDDPMLQTLFDQCYEYIKAFRMRRVRIILNAVERFYS